MRSTGGSCIGFRLFRASGGRHYIWAASLQRKPSIHATSCLKRGTTYSGYHLKRGRARIQTHLPLPPHSGPTTGGAEQELPENKLTIYYLYTCAYSDRVLPRQRRLEELGRELGLARKAFSLGWRIMVG